MVAPAIIREIYSSNDEKSKMMMGPMKFPLLDFAINMGYGTWWSVTRYFYPKTTEQYESIKQIVSGSSYTTKTIGNHLAHIPVGLDTGNIINVNAIGGKITVIRGDWSLADLGLEVKQNGLISADGTMNIVPGKEAKRMKGLARPFRIYDVVDKLKVLVVRGDFNPAIYDGASLISSSLVNQCIDNLEYPNQEDYILHKMRKWFLDQMVFNGVLIGNLIDAETGKNLECMAKGQFIRTELPNDIDIVTSEENLKSEITGCKHAFVGIDPQGPKEAKEDQQTVANHWFLCSPANARIRLDDEAYENKKEIFSGKFNQPLKDLVSKNFRTDNAYSETSFSKLMKWRVHSWAAHGMDYRVSPWLTNRIANIWPKSLGDKTANWGNTLKVSIPCSIRAQVICESMYNLWRFYEGKLPISLPKDHLHWSEELKLGVVSDEDWINIVIPSHGGCDQDDFFVIRWVTIVYIDTNNTVDVSEDDPALEGIEIESVTIKQKKIIIHRNPNTRGEYSIWKPIKDDWYPTYTRPTGEKISFPEVDMQFAPMQILDAISQGITSYLKLPSEQSVPVKNPSTVKVLTKYRPSSALDSVRQSMHIEGGYGQYELAVRARNSVDPYSFDDKQINSESAIDAFAQVRALDDQKFILADRTRIISNIIKALKPVDEYIAPRLGNSKIYGTSEGPIAKIKKEVASVIQDYKADVASEISKLKEPVWLEELGENEYFTNAVELLKYMRSAMYRSSIVMNQSAESITAVTNVDQDWILQEYIDQISDRETKAKFMLAFWHACWTIPTSQGRLTDQPVFGTCLYPHLLDALCYFGLAHKPYLTSDGHIDRYDLLEYKGNKTLKAHCNCCSAEFHLKLEDVSRYWNANGTCVKCKR